MKRGDFHRKRLDDRIVARIKEISRKMLQTQKRKTLIAEQGASWEGKNEECQTDIQNRRVSQMEETWGNCHLTHFVM